MEASANGITLHYDTFGDPAHPAIVLIMGLGAQMILWPEALCRDLAARGHYVVRFDNRDCGLSSRISDAPVPDITRGWLRARVGLPLRPAYGLNDMARDVVSLLDALGIAGAHIVGASMGGMIAQILAARHAERVTSTTLIMTTSGHPRLPGPSLRLQLRMSRGPRDRSREGRIRYGMETWRVIGSPGYPLSEAELREKVETSFDRGFYPAGMLRQMHAILASGSRTRLVAGIHQPVTVIHGDADPLVPTPAAHDLARRLPQADLQIVEGMGHDFPPALLPRIADHITDCVARGEQRPAWAA